MVEGSKPPRKPIRSEYDTDGQCRKKLRERKAKKPPTMKGDTSRHYMTQQYYTEKILPVYIQLLHE